MLRNVFRLTLLIVLAIIALLILLPLSALGVVPIAPKIVAGALCSLVGLLILGAIAAAIVAKMFLGKFRKALREATLDTSATGKTPATIHLTRRDALLWTATARVAGLIDAFRGLGFEPIGYFTVDEMPDIKLQAFIHRGENLWGVLYEHAKVGVWVDLVARYQDGGSVTLSNSPHGGVMDPRPGHDKIHDKEAEPAELFAKWQGLADRPAVQPIEPADFQPSFEKAYTDEMAWRAARGGPTPEEIRRAGEASGKEYSEETIAAAGKLLTGRSRETLEELILREFARLEGTTYEELQGIREQFIVVDDGMAVDAVMEHFADVFAEGLLQRPASLGLPPRKLFSSLNHLLPPSRQHKLVRTVTTPVEADVYLAV
ncbi:MAG: hypothetical protein NTW19_19800 [Planctomycetota bacterium]|nr:hypothetical protein [Planctomycetota bacterium]